MSGIRRRKGGPSKIKAPSGKTVKAPKKPKAVKRVGVGLLPRGFGSTEDKRKSAIYRDMAKRKKAKAKTATAVKRVRAKRAQ